MSLARMQLTERDRALMHTLSVKVKLLPLGHVRAMWWQADARGREMPRRLAALEAAGWVERRTVVGRMFLGSPEPLATWAPKQLPPDFADVVWRARRRALSAVAAVRVVRVTPAAASMSGGAVRVVRPSEVSHDLMVAGVYAALVARGDARAAKWRGESVLEAPWGRDGSPMPDAVIALPGREILVEVVGSSYTPGDLRTLHEFCVLKGVTYELW